MNFLLYSDWVEIIFLLLSAQQGKSAARNFFCSHSPFILTLLMNFSFLFMHISRLYYERMNAIEDRWHIISVIILMLGSEICLHWICYFFSQTLKILNNSNIKIHSFLNTPLSPQKKSLNTLQTFFSHTFLKICFYVHPSLTIS